MSTTIVHVKENLTQALQSNREMLKTLSLSLGQQLLGSDFEFLLYDDMTDHRTDTRNYSIIEETICHNIYTASNLIFRQRQTDSFMWEDNEIFFNLQVNPSYYYLNHIDYKSFVDNKISFLQKCFLNFFKEENNSRTYELLSNNWTLLEDALVSLDDFNSMYVYNTNRDGWNDYVIKTVEHFFPPFKYSKYYSDKMIRILKPIGNGLLLGIEFDGKKINSSKSNGFVEFSDYLNVVLIHEEYEKRTKKGYIFEGRNDILSIGMLGNPFIFPFTSFNGYMGTFRINRNSSNCFSVLSRLPFDYERKDNGKYLIRYEREYQEKCKKYLFFYIAGTSFVANGYLRFIEKSICDLL